jgi:acyl-[acyl carrier protein]--UDP-N-acetylglucosamine O-acyltransferase
LRASIRNAIKTYFFKGLNGKNALEELEKADMPPEVEHFVDFIRASKRGIMSGNPKYSAFDEEVS